MRKLLSLAVCFFLTINIFAQTYSTEQKRLISDISSYLSKEGYSPEEQKDGLKFRSEGTNYYVEVSSEDKSPMFLRLCRYVRFSDEIKPEKAVNELNSYNAKLAVKVSSTDNGLVLASEMFVRKQSDFTDVFPTLLMLIKATYQQITE